MTQTRQSSRKSDNGLANGHTNAYANGAANGHVNGYIKSHDLNTKDQKTERSRWRLLDEEGRHTWHYLKTDKEMEEWPQTTADKFHMGLPTVFQGTAQSHNIH
jgi:lanosterol synthase